MAQGKVTEYFSNRKRGINAVPSKRRKLHNIADVFTEDNVLPAAEISPIEQILPTKLPNLKTKRKLRSTKLPVAEDTAEISTAICDDHHAPCTPSKQVKISNSTDVPVGTGRSKRVRRQNVERKDMLNDNEAGPSYDFSNYDKKKTPCSAKKRLILHVPTTQPVGSMIHNTQATKPRPSLKVNIYIAIFNIITGTVLELGGFASQFATHFYRVANQFSKWSQYANHFMKAWIALSFIYC